MEIRAEMNFAKFKVQILQPDANFQQQMNFNQFRNFKTSFQDQSDHNCQGEELSVNLSTPFERSKAI